MTNTVPISGLQSGTPDAADLIPGVDVFDPTQSANGTTKKYVRWSEFNFILQALGQRVLDACRVTTTGNLSASYNNGVSGIGAQLTNNGVKAALSINGVSLNFGDRVLVKNQTAALQNGIYQVVSVGSTSINWVLERSSDYDQPAEIQQFDTVMAVEGTIGNNTAYQLTSVTPLIIGTDSISFSAYDINLVQDVVPVSRGGTGQTSYTNGQLLIGRTSDGTLVKNTLTAGTGISIVNSGGAITIATSPTTTVNSVTGTLNRIIASPSTGDVVLDISPSYIGQTSITTLGAIVAGTWNATTIATNKGGTGQTTYNNGEILIGNASAGGTLSKALITAGAGISITNGAGTITIASTVSGVTSVGISGANGIGVSGTPITSSGIITLSLGAITPSSVAAVGTVTGSNLSGTNTGDQTMFGAANRITATAGGTNYTFDIAGTYVGQTSITTLGTITTGSWAAATIPVDKGGTGQTSYTNGQLLIGNSTGNTLTKATLTAGTGISITNGTGSITISATGASGTVTSVAVTGANGIGVSGSPITSSGTIDLTLGTITGATWNGNVISTTYTQAQLITALGTADRITVSGTSTDIIIDISPSYAGQSSINTLGTIGTGIWEGNSISTSYTDAKVVSVAGTGGRISVGGTASIPAIDIASNYVGQTTITTLGTVTSGTWNAATVGVGYGGTGQSTYTDGQLLIGNSAGNTLAKNTLTAGTGVSIVNGAGSITISLDGAASVSSVSGTANRITASPTVGAVVVDIAGTYVGQTSITTLGTIVAGVWNGTVIDGTYINYNATNLKVTSNALNTIQDIATSSTPRFTNVILPGVAYGELLVANDTSALTSVAYSSTGGTSNICGRDLYGNSRANSYYSDLTDTVSAGGTTALLESSSRLQTLSGTASQTYTLPDATFLLDGFTFEFFNNSTGTLTVKNFASTTLASVVQGGYVSVVLENTATPAGRWNIQAAGAGVDTITGTANQINVSASTGAVTLSLASTLILPGTLQLGGDLNGGGHNVTNIINFTFGDNNGYLKTHTHDGDSFALQAYDVDGASYTSFISLTAGNTPSCLITGNTTYNGNKIGLAYGGTNADLSATGGAGQYLKQSSSGAAITVGTIPASEIVSGAALTKTDDTNVTLTLGGSPSTALLAATSLTLGWTGVLGISRGGTNASSQTTNGICYYNGSSITSNANFYYTTSISTNRFVMTDPNTSGSLYFTELGSGFAQWIVSYGSLTTKTSFCNNSSIQEDFQLAASGVSASIVVASTLMTIGTTSLTDVRFVRGGAERLRVTSSGASVTGDISGTSDLYLLKSSSSTFYQQTSETGIGLGSRYRMRRSQGTVASPTDVTEPDQDLGAFYFDAYRNGGWYGVAAQFVTMDGTPSDTSLPTAYNWLTTPVGGVAATVKMTLNNAGDLWLKKCLNVGLLNTSPSGLAHFIGESTTDTRTYIDQYRTSSSSYGGMAFRKAAGTYASPSTVFNGYTLGSIEFYGYDGTGFLPAANILAVVDSTPGTNDMPTSLVFRTTADGAAATTEAARFTSGQMFNIGTSVPTINTMVSGTSLIQSSVRLISAYFGAASANSSYFLGSGNDGGLLQLFGAGGTIASPTALTTDSRMGGVFGRGYADTGYSNAVAGITFHAETTFTDTSTPSYIAFATTASGATTRTERVRMASNGNVGFGTSSIGAPVEIYKLAIPNDTNGGGVILSRYSNAGTQYRGGAIYSRANSNISGLDMLCFGVCNTDAKNPYSDFDQCRMVIVSNGNTGINLTSPSAQLHVYKSIYETPSLTFGAGCATIIRGENAELAFGFGYPSYPGMYLQARYTGDTSVPLFLNPVGGNVAIATTDTSRRLVVAGVGAANDQLLYLRQTNDYGYTFNLDSSSSGRLYVKGVNAGIETSAIITLDRTNTFFGIGETAPYFKCMIREQTTSPQLSIVYSGSGATTNKELELGYNGASGSGYGWIQAIHNGTAYTPLCLNPYGGSVGVGTLSPSALFDVAGFIRSTGTTSTPSTGAGVEILYNSGNGYVQAYDRSTSAYKTLYVEGLNIAINPNSGGSVAIGNTGATPRAKLEVVGDIWTDWSDRFIGTVYQAGASYKMGFATTTSARTLDLIAMSADSSAIRFWVGSTPTVNAYIDYVGNVVLGSQVALATNAQNGFVYIPTSAGAPTAGPTAFTGKVAMEYDTTNNKLYVYNGGWKSVTLT